MDSTPIAIETPTMKYISSSSIITTPWSKRTLIPFWIIPNVCSITLSTLGLIFGASFTTHYRNGQERPGGNGIPDNLFWAAIPLFTLFTIFGIVFTAVQGFQYGLHVLHPYMVLWQCCLMTAAWVIIVIIGIPGIVLLMSDQDDENPVYWDRITTVLLLDILMIIPSIAQLVYASIVYTRYKKEERSSGTSARRAIHGRTVRMIDLENREGQVNVVEGRRALF